MKDWQFYGAVLLFALLYILPAYEGLSDNDAIKMRQDIDRIDKTVNSLSQQNVRILQKIDGLIIKS